MDYFKNKILDKLNFLMCFIIFSFGVGLVVWGLCIAPVWLLRILMGSMLIFISLCIGGTIDYFKHKKKDEDSNF